MHVSHVPDLADQAIKAHDLGVRLPLGPPDGRTSETPIILVIPLQTPLASPAGSPRLVDASPGFDPNASNEEADHRASPNTNVGHPPLRPKW